MDERIGIWLGKGLVINPKVAISITVGKVVTHNGKWRALADDDDEIHHDFSCRAFFGWTLNFLKRLGMKKGSFERSIAESFNAWLYSKMDEFSK